MTSQETLLIQSLTLGVWHVLGRAIGTDFTPLQAHALYVAKYVAELSEGFQLLARFKQENAARIMVRPALEAVAGLRAARLDPNMVFNKTMKNMDDERKLLNELADNVKTQASLDDVKKAADALDAERIDVENFFKAAFPSTSFISRHDLTTAPQVFKAAKLGEWYLAYRDFSCCIHSTIKYLHAETPHPVDRDYATLTFSLLYLLEDLSQIIPALAVPMAPYYAETNIVYPPPPIV